MIDVSDVAERLPAVPEMSSVSNAVIRWIPGFKNEAPKRNFVLLIAYLELLLFGLALLRHTL